MGIHIFNLKHIVAAALAIVVFSAPLAAQSAKTVGPMPELLSQLRSAPNAEDAQRIEKNIQRAWSKSGSAAIDLLLKRGRDALRAKKLDAAVEHLTALTDHAPDFAEGWHLRASAYYQLRLYGPALGDLRQTLILNPSHFDAIQGVGAIFEQLGDPKRAFEAYQMVLTIHPFQSDVLDAMKRLEPMVKGPKL